jgi:two-component system nitrate/nitrite response regulator NarL
VIRVLISDRGPIFRDGLQALLQSESDLTVVGQASMGLEALELVRTLEPDVLMIELEPRRSGLDVVRKLSAAGSPVRTIVLAAAIERPDIITALQAGARGVFLKDSTTSLLFRCIRSVMKGEYWIGREGVADLVSVLSSVRPETPAGAPKPNFGLTGRETQILLAVVEGLTNRQIAQQLSISHDTVKHHVRKVFAKVGVSKRVELAVFAMNNRLSAPQAQAAQPAS